MQHASPARAHYPRQSERVFFHLLSETHNRGGIADDASKNVAETILQILNQSRINSLS